jgi:AcrR family transcriptional regulator
VDEVGEYVDVLGDFVDEVGDNVHVLRDYVDEVGDNVDVLRDLQGRRFEAILDRAASMRAKTEYKKSETSRQQVVDAAIRTLAKRGFANTSVGDIADACGMSKGVVHYHFKSKDDLIGRVLVECNARMSARVRAAWDAPGAPTERIRKVLREMWAARTDGSPEMRVISDLTAAGVHDPVLRKALSEMFHRARQELVDEFVASFTSIGLKPKVPPQVIPRLVIATLDGLGLHQLFDPPPEEDEREIFRALEVIAFSLFEL